MHGVHLLLLQVVARGLRVAALLKVLLVLLLLGRCVLLRLWLLHVRVRLTVVLCTRWWWWCHVWSRHYTRAAVDPLLVLL
jgi:hypothetical protein